MSEQAKNVEKRKLNYLEVMLTCGGLTFHRIVTPESEATAAEIREAMEKDEDFLNPFIGVGFLTVFRDGKKIVLATYGREMYDETIAADIDDVQESYENEEGAG